MTENDGGAFALIEIGDFDVADGELFHWLIPPTRLVGSSYPPAVTGEGNYSAGAGSRCDAAEAALVTAFCTFSKARTSI